MREPPRPIKIKTIIIWLKVKERPIHGVIVFLFRQVVELSSLQNMGTSCQTHAGLPYSLNPWILLSGLCLITNSI